MNVIEQALVSRTGKASDCEDALCVTDWFVCVVDGVTFKGATLVPGPAPGRIAAGLICECVEQFPFDIDFRTAVHTLTVRIQEFCKTLPSAAPGEDYRKHIAASVVVLSRHRREIWSVGDCQILMADRIIVNRNNLDSVAADARALYLETELLRGKSIPDLLGHDTGRDFIQPLLSRQHEFLNLETPSEFCYAAVCGVPLPERLMIHPIGIPTDVTEVVLASDGYPHLAPTLEESEKLLKKAIEEDPLRFRKAKSTKGMRTGNVSFDDRSYIRVRL